MGGIFDFIGDLVKKFIRIINKPYNTNNLRLITFSLFYDK